MKLKISPSQLCGEIKAPPSKSYAHRMLICAALAGGESRISGISGSEDMLATLDCIEALGARYEMHGGTVTVRGRSGKTPEGAVLRCRESGSTLRFMIPPALTGATVRFEGTQRLLERGIGIYEELLGANGIGIKKDGNGIEMSGALEAGDYVLRGDVSSQFITGLLFALPEKRGESTVRVLPPVESRAYIDITLDALRSFGIEAAEPERNLLVIQGGQRYMPSNMTVEGDWSNAAALKAFDLIGGSVRVTGLRTDSIQGDRVCLEYFERLREPGAVLDISGCPDLGPVLFALAAATGNGASFTGTRRLRIKESDRAAAMAQEMSAFGIETVLSENAAVIKPGRLRTPARELSAHNDHRIVMALTLLCSVTGGAIDGVQAVNKSYPGYFDDLASLGLEAEYEA